MLPPLQELLAAFEGCDSLYDGVFYVAVRTTGVVCRPSCKPPRKPLLKNVEFYASLAEAQEKGYRPCKLCRPDELSAKQPDWVQKIIEMCEQEPDNKLSDQHLRQMGIDPVRLRRFFVKHYGKTFRQWQREHRMSDALRHLRNGGAVGDVLLHERYESSSGFGSAFRKTFGHSPKQGKNMDCIVTTWIATPLGDIQLGASSQGVCFLEFDDPSRLATQQKALQQSLGMSLLSGTNEHIEHAKEELAAYFAGTLHSFTVPLLYKGSDFQQRVWNELRRIPYGETRSYADIANSIGNSTAVRAVGRTNGLNRISLIIPCHRVVNKGGELGGYGGGLWRKRLLLALEQGTTITQESLHASLRPPTSERHLSLFDEQAQG